jgi:S1-C subfamily serine protease
MDRRDFFTASAATLAGTALAQDTDKHVADAESARVKVIEEKIRPTVVAVFGRGGGGGGSGVIIDEAGYALTNFHVVRPTGPTPQCGLADGTLYEAVVVGMDQVGDVALIKLIPDKPDKKFPFAKLADSDKVKAGDWSIAAGNPFLLATDFTPTITYGLVSGVHRYQFPSGTILEYTDCIQIETSINPGNSGGPLFNLDGDVIGINGRGSFEKRGRVNSGVGYAISINQIKHFLGHLRGGHIVDHATLGARIRTSAEGQAMVTDIVDEADAYRRGLRLGHEIVSFAGRGITTVNHYKNVLGIYPRGWRLPLVYRYFDERRKEMVRKETLVRLMGLQPRDLGGPPKPEPGKPPMPMPILKPLAPPAQGPGAKLYEAKKGFANYYFNKQNRERVLASLAKLGDFKKITGEWTFEGIATLPGENPGQSSKSNIRCTIDSKHCKLRLGVAEYSLEPLATVGTDKLRQPLGSGGALLALFLWRELLVTGPKAFVGKFDYGGHEPFYPSGVASQILTETLETESAAVPCKWFLSKTDATVLGIECYPEEFKDPGEVVLGEYREVEGQKLPHQMTWRFGDSTFATVAVQSWKCS